MTRDEILVLANTISHAKRTSPVPYTDGLCVLWSDEVVAFADAVKKAALLEAAGWFQDNWQEGPPIARRIRRMAEGEK